jgi:hypothetical protein
MKEWTTPMTGKCGRAAVLAIGVRQQSVYQRKTLLERRRHRKGVRARGELHAPGRHLKDVRPAGRVEHVWTLKETRERLAVITVADEAEAGGRWDVARDAAHAAAPAPKREIHDAIVAWGQSGHWPGVADRPRFYEYTPAATGIAGHAAMATLKRFQ